MRCEADQDKRRLGLVITSCLYTFLFVGSFFGWGPMVRDSAMLRMSWYLTVLVPQQLMVRRHTERHKYALLLLTNFLIG
jgi:hypothetical protein